MKGLVLAAGKGTRLRPLTYSQRKELIPIANKPMLFYAIESLIEAGIKEIGVVVGSDADHVIKTLSEFKGDASFTFVHQPEPKGIAHAIQFAHQFVGNEEFVVMLGDNLLKGGIVEYAREFLKQKPAAQVLLAKVQNPQQFGVAELVDGKLVRLVEKPRIPPSDLALVGVYFFTPVIFEAIKELKPSWRGEFEVTEAIQWLIDKNYEVSYQMASAWWKDTGRPEDILEANRLVLDELEPCLESEIKGKVRGRVKIGKDCYVSEDSVVEGPAIIGNGCRIEGSFIGPYTSIGNNCKVVGSEIYGSILMDGAEVIGMSRIVESLIGRAAKVGKGQGKPVGLRLVVGDFSQLSL